MTRRTPEQLDLEAWLAHERADAEREDNLIDDEAEAAKRIALAQRIESLDGLFVGQLAPEEYEDLVEAGWLRYAYEGASGVLGLAKLRRTTK